MDAAGDVPATGPASSFVLAEIVDTGAERHAGQAEMATASGVMDTRRSSKKHFSGGAIRAQSGGSRKVNGRRGDAATAGNSWLPFVPTEALRLGSRMGPRDGDTLASPSSDDGAAGMTTSVRHRSGDRRRRALRIGAEPILLARPGAAPCSAVRENKAFEAGD